MERPAREVRDSTLFVAVRQGGLIVRLGYPLAEITGKLHLLRRDILLASLVSLLLATMLAAFMAHRVALSHGAHRRLCPAHRVRRSLRAD